MQPRIEDPGLGRWIQMAVRDPWQIIASISMIVGVFSFAMVVALTRRSLPPTGTSLPPVTLVTPSPESSLTPSIVVSPAPQPAQAVQRATAPPQVSSPTPRPHPTPSPTPRPAPTPTPGPTVVDNPPTAALTVTVSSGRTIMADASGSTDTDATQIASYRFTFGDGSSPVGPQAAGSAAYTYSNPGTYTVTVRVTDTAGYFAITTASVTVS